jgi:hypothetical protein
MIRTPLLALLVLSMGATALAESAQHLEGTHEGADFIISRPGSSPW